MTRDVSPNAVSWSVSGLSYRPAPNAPHALDNVSLEVPGGQLTAIVGPNGAGKSTLLRLLLGIRAPERGSIAFQGKPISQWSRADLAKIVGVVSQSETFAFPLPVDEMIAMGRYPHLGHWKRESAEDRAAIRKAMELCDVAQFAARDIMSLSGGELQRVRVARALAQEPTTLALDEPTSALDIAHEMATFELLRALRAQGLTVLLVTHHLNLAARYADRVIVLHNGRVAATGAPAEVLTPDLVQQVWQWPVVITPHPGPGPDTGAVQITPLAGASTDILSLPS